MNTMMKRRLDLLEKEAVASLPFRTITCIPFSSYSDQFLANELSPGVYLAAGRRESRIDARTVHYSSMELLRRWLADPGQLECHAMIYTIVTS